MNIFSKSTRINNDVPPPLSIAKHPAWLRLEDQVAWYDRKSNSCQTKYKIMKFAQITLALLIPAMSFLPSESVKWSTVFAGAFIALLETVQHMNQYSTLWVTYRSTAERLKHEKYLFLSAAGAYRDFSEAERLVKLAERVEENVSTEHANWYNESQRKFTNQNKENG
jgi:hypothetical protein